VCARFVVSCAAVYEFSVISEPQNKENARCKGYNDKCYVTKNVRSLWRPAEVS